MNTLLRLLLLIVLSAMTAWAADDPIIAIWRDHDGHRPKSEAPYLRIAIWSDGRIVFAKDRKKWSHELLEGRIEPERLAELKNAAEGTGVFELKGNCYLVPDAPVDCMMINFGTKQQMLYQTPSHPDARPRSDRFRCGGRESKFLAATALLHFSDNPREGSMAFLKP
jgi:hypothetical protein